jgi:hypothetical protein
MNTIQRTVEIDSSRKVLRLEEPLPETIGTGRMNATLVLESALSPEEKDARIAAVNHAAWREFLEALDKMPLLPGNDMPPRIGSGNWEKVLAEYEAMPPLVCDDMPPKLSLRELPL